MIDLTTRYLGLTLKSPLVASASPLTEHVSNVRRLEDAGAAAVVLHSLFEEQLSLESRQLDAFLSHGEEVYAEALSYFPDLSDYNLGPDGYLDLIRRSKEAVDVPIVASLNGVSSGGWIRFARQIEEAGADALELNVYYVPTDPDIPGDSVERMYLNLVSDVKAGVKIPVAVKVGPYFSSMAWMAKQLEQAGADAIVMFNRFYQPDFDLEALEVAPNLRLSTPDELRLRLRWAAILWGKVKCDLAITGGIHSASDALKAIMAGGTVAMMTSAVLRNGVDQFTRVREDMVRWMEEHEYESTDQMRGSLSSAGLGHPAAFERANYLKVLSSYVQPSGVA
jgi:dihydroorotate dehydrogenase (fumarate)